MPALSKKFHLTLVPPGPGDVQADKDRISAGLHAEFGTVMMPYQVLQTLYPICRKANWDLTITLVYVKTHWQITRVEAGDTTTCHYGLAVDLGSTTIIMQAVDLIEDIVLAEASIFNQQIAYGQDILSRIFYTKKKSTHLQEIQAATCSSLQQLLIQLQKQTRLPVDAFSIMVVSGNTTMIHFLLGIDPWPIFQTPYAPVFNQSDFLTGQQLNLPFGGLLYCLPSVANYLGGDTIAGLLIADLEHQKKPCIFMDIGTNGEIVIGYEKFLFAAAGAAGPALEGGISKSGMKASLGAVDAVKITQQVLEISTIGSGKPQGICGSGIVDLLAELLLNGMIDFSGRFIPEQSERIIKQEEQYVFVYAWKEDSATEENLVFTQADLLQFLDTKAAAHTMVTYLLDKLNLTMNDIERFYIAGAFGTHLNPESAIAIGLYPDLPREKFVFLGNSSLKGAYALLTHRHLLKKAEALQQNIQYLELGAADDYLTHMFAARFLPHTDLNTYPTVKNKLLQRGILKAR